MHARRAVQSVHRPRFGKKERKKDFALLLSHCMSVLRPLLLFSHLARCIKHMHYPNKRKTLRGRDVGPIFRLQWSSFAGFNMQKNPHRPPENSNFSPLFTAVSTPCQIASFLACLSHGSLPHSLFPWLLFLKPSKRPASEGLPPPTKRTSRLADVHWTKKKKFQASCQKLIWT